MKTLISHAKAFVEEIGSQRLALGIAIFLSGLLVSVQIGYNLETQTEREQKKAWSNQCAQARETLKRELASSWLLARSLSPALYSGESSGSLDTFETPSDWFYSAGILKQKAKGSYHFQVLSRRGDSESFNILSDIPDTALLEDILKKAVETRAPEFFFDSSSKSSAPRSFWVIATGSMPLSWMIVEIRIDRLLQGLHGEGWDPAHFALFNERTGEIFASSNPKAAVPKNATFLPIQIGSLHAKLAAWPETEEQEFRPSNIFIPLIGVLITAIIVLVFWILTRSQGRVEIVLNRLRKSFVMAEKISQSIAEAAPEAIITLDMQGVVQSVNPAATRIYRCPAEQIIGKPFADFVSPTTQAGSSLQLPHKFFETHPKTTRVVQEHYGLRADGEVFTAEMSFALNEAADVRVITAIVRDVTARKWMERTLAQSEARYRSLVENLPVAFFRFDKNTCFSDAAGLFWHAMDTHPEKWIGRPLAEAFGESEWAKVEAQYLRVLQGKTVEFDQLWGQHHVHMVLSPNYNAKGEVEGGLGFALDITERIRLQEQLLQSQKMEAVGTLAGGVAHDFNNLLTSILGFCSLLDLKMSPDSPHRNYLQKIQFAGQRASELTRSLLGFARKNQPVLKPFDLNVSVRNVLALVQTTFKPTIQFEVVLEPNLPSIMGDQSQMEQVILNLLVNARDAISENGLISIRSHKESAKTANERLMNETFDRDVIVLTIRDTGIGMDEKTQARIYEPFFTTKPVGQGTGLGMAVVYGVIKNHRGTIGLSSKPGEGTTFTLYLPVAENAGAVETNSHAMTGSGASIKV